MTVLRTTSVCFTFTYSVRFLNLFFGFFFLLSVYTARAQRSIDDLVNLRTDTLLVSDTLNLSGISYFQHSVQATIIGTQANTKVSIEHGYDKWWCATPEQPQFKDSTFVTWTYRIFIPPVSEVYNLLDSVRLMNERPIDEILFEGQGISVGELRNELGAVDYRGSFGRGLRFGNSQNLVLDSRLDLQLNGDLGGGLTVAAVISDQNIPLQPEGNTVQLQEFDKLFITVSKDKHSLTAGDYSLRSQKGHFLRFDKNLQGLNYNYGGQDDDTRSSIGVAAARGQFNRTQLAVDDGNQGPYRLSGQRGEPFVIVLAGTERVYLDGRLLTRGVDQDYTIDYNRGELSFMPRLLINRFQRILVEYEYVDQEYLRTLVTAEAFHQEGRWTFYSQGLQQQDGLRRTGNPLPASAEQTLRNAVGSRTGTLVPSATPLEEGTANPLRYLLQIDTTNCGIDSIWVFTPEASDTEGFNVRFTDVGQGNGDYSLSTVSSANGASFEYVPKASDCSSQGRFAPLLLVQTPRSLRLLSFGGSYEIDSVSGVSWEVIGNNNDLNRYSSAGETTMAGYLEVNKAWNLGKGTLTALANLEGTGNGFEAIAPWRDQEFKRDWNLGTLAQSANLAAGTEQLSNVELAYKQKSFKALVSSKHYRQGEAFQGFRQNWLLGLNRGNWNLSHSGNNLAAERDGAKTGRTQLAVNALRNGTKWTQEFSVTDLKTSNYDAILDEATAVDRGITEWRAVASTREVDSLWQVGFTYQGRRDVGRLGSPSNAQMQNQLEVQLSNPIDRAHQVGLTATLRRGDNDSQQEGESYYLGRATHGFSTAKRWLRTSSILEAGSGQERRIALQYLRVQPGLGQYVWRDYNDDGVEDLDEFEVAVFADSASYIRTVLLTDDFVPTNTLNLNQSINLDFSRVGLQNSSLWSRFSALSTASLKRRALRSAGYAQLFELSIPDGDTSVVGDNLSWRSALYFNRARKALRAEVEHRQLSSRVISLQGLQVLRTSGQAANFRQPIKQSWAIELALDHEIKRSESEGLAARNFILQTDQISPSVILQPNAGLRAKLEASYREGKSDDRSASVIAQSIVAEFELRVAEAPDRKKILGGATIRSSLERINQRFTGASNSPVGFALLEGLQPGQSWIWSLSTDQQIGRSLQLSLRYDGRQLGKGRIVHTGQAQVQAIF